MEDLQNESLLIQNQQQFSFNPQLNDLYTPDYIHTQQFQQPQNIHKSNDNIFEEENKTNQQSLQVREQQFSFNEEIKEEQKQETKSDQDKQEQERVKLQGRIKLNQYQAAILNKLLPAGFRIEGEDNVLKWIMNRQNQQNQMNQQKKKQDQQKKIKKPINMKLSQNDMVQSEEEDIQDQLKTGQRQSKRDKQKVNYHNMLQGTGQVSERMDYDEFKQQKEREKLKKQSMGILNQKDLKTRCDHIFQLLRCHQSISLFLSCLDPGHPRFQELSKEFINLHSIELNYKQGKYISTFQLGNDIRKMWALGFKLYNDDEDKYQKTLDIQQYFEKIFEDIDNKPLQSNMTSNIQQPNLQDLQKNNQNQLQKKKIEKLEKDLKSLKESTNNPNMTKTARNYNQINTMIQQAQNTANDKPMTMEEKTSLKQSIGKLTTDQQRGIINIVQDCINQSNSEVFEFELDQLPNKKCRELESYVKKCIQSNQKKEKRKQADAQRRMLLKQQRMQQQQYTMQQNPQQMGGGMQQAVEGMQLAKRQNMNNQESSSSSESEDSDSEDNQQTKSGNQGTSMNNLWENYGKIKKGN